MIPRRNEYGSPRSRSLSQHQPTFSRRSRSGRIQTIVPAARPRRYLANSVITNQGHPAEHFSLLTSGRARYFHATPDGRKVILFWLPPGEIFGAAALLARPSDYLVSTEAVKPSSVLVWDRTTMRGLVARANLKMAEANHGLSAVGRGQPTEFCIGWISATTRPADNSFLDNQRTLPTGKKRIAFPRGPSCTRRSSRETRKQITSPHAAQLKP